MSQLTLKSGSGFFKQGSWMVMAAVFGGICMFGVHPLNNYIPNEEYARVGTLLSVFLWLQIPALGLQNVFVDQAAAALTDEHQRRLRGTVKKVLLGTFLLWLGMVLFSFLFRVWIRETFKIPQPAILWMTLLLALTALWSPIFMGVLQGRQNFFWLGWISILSGLGRVLFAYAMVFVFAATNAVGILTGILLSAIAALAIPAWLTRDTWRGEGKGVELKPWFARVIPFTLGMGVPQFLTCLDMLMVTVFFSLSETANFVSVATVGRGLILLTAPLVSVMFPKLVRSAALSEKSNTLSLALFSALGLAASVIIFLTFFSRPVFALVYPKFVSMTGLIGSYAWAVLPLAIANLLISNLLAKKQFDFAYYSPIIAMLYFLGLTLWHGSFLQVIQVMGCINSGYLAMALFFTWRAKTR